MTPGDLGLGSIPGAPVLAASCAALQEGGVRPRPGTGPGMGTEILTAARGLCLVLRSGCRSQPHCGALGLWLRFAFPPSVCWCLGLQQFAVPGLNDPLAGSASNVE